MSWDGKLSMNEGSRKAPRCNIASATTLKTDMNSSLWCSKLLCHKYTTRRDSYAVPRRQQMKEDLYLMKKVNNVKVLAFTGVLVAMSIILTRVVAIPIGRSEERRVGKDVG